MSLSQPADDDGMAYYRLRLDPEGREVLEAMLGPLSAPRPTPACPDLRTSDQRRADALVEICRRAAAAGGAAPATTKAAVYVTMDFQDLQDRSGAATSLLTGQLLPPETIRRIACDAQIIPVVLGTDSAVLDMGRAGGCSPPGSCTRCGCETGAAPSPAAQRLLSGLTRTTSSHWVDGGQTSLLNAALLCGRHHTIAHQRGWTATATTSEVTWHL